MKRSLLLGLGAFALVATVPFVSDAPVLASLQQAGEAIAQAFRGPEVQLNLSVEKKTLEVAKDGQQKVTWAAMGDKVTAVPGDVFRYTVSSNNAGDVAATNLVVTQPIPPQMSYVLASAESNNGATITYSIDAGKTFVANPTVKVTLPDGRVEVQPAPAEAYTHIRWAFGSELDPSENAKAFYQVQVR